MSKKTMSAREEARQKILIGILLIILPAGIRALNLDLGVLGLFIGVVSLVGIVLIIIGVVGLVKNPKLSE